MAIPVYHLVADQYSTIEQTILKHGSVVSVRGPQIEAFPPLRLNDVVIISCEWNGFDMREFVYVGGNLDTVWFVGP